MAQINADHVSMTDARLLETSMHMAPNPFYPRDMVRIARINRMSLISVKVELTDGTIQYLNPACLVHAVR